VNRELEVKRLTSRAPLKVNKSWVERVGGRLYNATTRYLPSLTGAPQPLEAKKEKTVGVTGVPQGAEQGGVGT
jgi:hypothetical protein